MLKNNARLRVPYQERRACHFLYPNLPILNLQYYVKVVCARITHWRRISRRVSSDTNTYTDNNVYGASSVDETSTYQLCGILQDWKQHLSAQKSELQHYYKSMVSALERDAVEPIDSASNVGHYDESVPSELSFRRLNEQSSSEYTGVRGSTVLSDGTLSVLGDYDCHANDIKRQERVIQQIKLKIADLESLLDNTRNISCDPDDDTESMYMASPPYRSYSIAQNTVVNKPTARKTIIHTINGLVSKLNNEDRECCFNMINGVLIESRNHRGMAMREKNVNQTVVTRLARQIHHVMRDAIHPEQRTDVLLAVYAARNLVDRLSKSAKMETFFLQSVPSLQTIGLQLVENVEQLFQMSNHLKKQAVSYKKQDIFRFVQLFIRIAQKIMALSYTLVSECYHAMNLETRETVPINHTRKQIRQNLNCQKISILNNELTNLEQLLKSGDPMVAQLSANEGPVVESSCDNLSDSDMESVTSCSTCISNETQKPVKRARNPYLFPGGPDSVDQNVQPSSFQSQSVVIDNNRLPTRPVKNSLPVNPYNRQPESGTDVKEAYLKGNNFSNQTSTHFFESDRMHQVEASEHLLYAKQLNQLVRSKPKESRMRYDVGTTEITECKKNVCGDLNTYAETKIDESLPKQIKKEKQHTNVKKETVSSSYNNNETFCSGDGSQLNQTEPKEDSASCVKKGEEGDYDALCTLSMKGELSEGTEHEVAKNPDLKLKLKDERNVLEE
uniref:uncharacterized protein LOC100182321 isoform X2 n=1 Tax=Ciona intestinalis TaxID=7719 RepID=UPI0002B8D595|nr:uncharacterized protein LOC100182321 isoform X2 [Ciona intestinalis]|eukprot:XP_002119937.2 uncharacterized protein LOC100182321 isoform X2 [Ciona intestinalis]